MDRRSAGNCRPFTPVLRGWQAIALIGCVIALPVGFAPLTHQRSRLSLSPTDC